jgi:tetratricopeptide (TPR) repeat protein
MALEKLQTDSTAEAGMRAKHAQHFATFAAQRETLLHGPQGADALQALEHEIENLRAGWGWASATYAIETLGRYSIALHDFCAIRGWEIEGRRLFQMAAAAVREWAAREAGTDVQITAAVRVLSCYAGLEYTLGDLAVAEEVFQQCRILLTAIAAEDTPELLYIYKQLGLIAYQRGTYAKALEYLQFTLQIAEESPDKTKLGDTLLSIGLVALAQGDWQRAEAALQRGLALYHGMNFEWGIGHMLRFAGMLALARDERETAYQQYQRSLVIMQQLGHRIGEALALDQLGMLYLAENQLDQSAAMLRQALAIFHELGVDSGIMRTLCHLGRLAVAKHDYQEAQQHFLQAIALARPTQMLPLQIESAAGALHLLTHTYANSAIEPALCAAIDTLWQHPACSADTRRYITSFRPQQRAERAYGADRTDRPWNLERVQQTIAEAIRER